MILSAIDVCNLQRYLNICVIIKYEIAENEYQDIKNNAGVIGYTTHM